MEKMVGIHLSQYAMWLIQNQRMVKSLQMNLMETMIQKVANQIRQEENVVAER